MMPSLSNLSADLSNKLHGKKCENCKCFLEFEENVLLHICVKWEKL